MSSSVCLSVCLSAVCSVHNSGTTRPSFTEVSVDVTCGRRSVVLWRRYSLPVFVDDVMFAHNGDSSASSTDLTPWRMLARQISTGFQAKFSNAF